jgi:hypothetical protein
MTAPQLRQITIIALQPFPEVSDMVWLPFSAFPEKTEGAHQSNDVLGNGDKSSTKKGIEQVLISAVSLLQGLE